MILFTKKTSMVKIICFC